MKDKLVTISARIDLKDLATILTWLHSKGIIPSNMSELARFSHSALAEMIQREGGASFPSVGEAAQALENKGIALSRSKGSRTGKDLFQAISLEKFGEVSHTKERAQLEEEFSTALEDLIEQAKRTKG